jgi:hypothetical protein
VGLLRFDEAKSHLLSFAKKAAVGSMGGCNIFCSLLESGDDANGTDGTAGALHFAEERTLAAVEARTVAE